MSLASTFWWGCVGGLLAYLVVFALPELKRAYARARKTRRKKVVPLRRVLLAIGIGIIFLALGGGAAIFIGDATSYKHAVAYGLGFEAILGGAIRGAAL